MATRSVKGLTDELRRLPALAATTEADVRELSWRTQQRTLLALLGSIPGAEVRIRVATRRARSTHFRQLREEFNA